MRARWFLIPLLILGCQASNGAGRVKLKDFYQEKSVIQLAEAAADGDVQQIDSLIANGADVNAVGKDGMTPLLWALKEQSKAGVKRLVEKGANPNVAIKSGDSVTSLAAAMDDPEFLKIVLAHGGNPNYVNAQNNVTPTPLFMAISRLSSANVRTLIDAGADMNYKRMAGQETSMMAAAGLNQWEIVYLLLAAGADPALRDRWNYTVVYYLEHNNIVAGTNLFQWRQRVIDFLREKGMAVNPKAPLEGAR